MQTSSVAFPNQRDIWLTLVWRLSVAQCVRCASVCRAARAGVDEFFFRGVWAPQVDGKPSRLGDYLMALDPPVRRKLKTLLTSWSATQLHRPVAMRAVGIVAHA